LLSIVDPIRVVWVTAGCSLVAALCMAAIRLLPAQPEPVGTPELGGLATIRASAELRAMTVLAVGGAFVTAPLVSVLLPAHFVALEAPGWFGYATAGLALGSLVGAATYGSGAISRRTAYVAGIAVMTLGLAGSASLHGLWPVAIGLGLVGVGNGLLSPVLLVFFVEEVRESVRGRVLGLFNAFTTAAIPVALGGLALLLSSASVQTAAVVVFVGWLAVAAYSLSGPTLGTLTRSRPGTAPAVEEAVGADH
jgi:MFS family permease